MRRDIIVAAVAVAITMLSMAAYFGYSRDHRTASGAVCETFHRTPQPGLFDAFRGTVCSDDPAVKEIAKNYQECLASGANVAACSSNQLEYFDSSGAYPDDAQRALFLVLRAAGQA